MTEAMLERCPSLHPTATGVEVALDDNHRPIGIKRQPVRCWHKGDHRGFHNNGAHEWDDGGGSGTTGGAHGR